MINILFELEMLKTNLEQKGLDGVAIETILSNARRDIDIAFNIQGEGAMQQAIESGVQQRSSDFINDLTLDKVNMMLTTQTGNFTYDEPPMPMLPGLLKGAKPMKDGSGVYKVIPIGVSGNNRPKVSNNIYDTWKQINAERIEAAKTQYSKVTPKGSKTQFRTATSKQSANTSWVIPEKQKDFTEDMKSINTGLSITMDDIVKGIVREYVEGF